MIAIIDYGVGNLFSLSRSLKFVGADCIITSDKDKIDSADKVILPGVGAFGDASVKLAEHGLDKLVIEQAHKGRPLLGICLGMQLLFEGSLEFGQHKGLGLLPGAVRPLRDEVKDLKIPHMGWNKLSVLKENPLLDIDSKPYMYFVHSFFAEVSECTIASATYGSAVISAIVRQDNVFGAQFHPEKSGEDGLKILKAFCDM